MLKSVNASHVQMEVWIWQFCWLCNLHLSKYTRLLAHHDWDDHRHQVKCSVAMDVNLDYNPMHLQRQPHIHIRAKHVNHQHRATNEWSLSLMRYQHTESNFKDAGRNRKLMYVSGTQILIQMNEKYLHHPISTPSIDFMLPQRRCHRVWPPGNNLAAVANKLTSIVTHKEWH